MSAVAELEMREVARPRHILVPLIKKDWAEMQEAAEKATEPYQLSIGQKLLEGKATDGGFKDWVERNFQFGMRQAQRYMGLATTTIDIQKRPGRSFMEDYRRQTETGYVDRKRVESQSWHEPVKDAINRASNIRNLHEETLKRAEERELERKLALQLIDIGFKALATKLHPDHGGSRDAMQRLNRVRDRLKASA